MRSFTIITIIALTGVFITPIFITRTKIRLKCSNVGYPKLTRNFPYISSIISIPEKFGDLCLVVYNES